jgi:acetolactate synthase-1/2/3 large subunit
MVRVADYIINKLHDFEINHIFMVTGRGALFLTDAVAAHKKITSISTHHEQSASYAAYAYAQRSNKMGACLVSTGCASTNAITGVLNCWQDNLPVVFLSGQNKLNETTYHTKVPLRTYGQQEANIIPMVESITKYAIMITDPNKVVYELEKALYLANEGRKGPVWIDVPLDVQNMRIEPEELEHFIPPEQNIPNITNDILYLKEELTKAKRAVVLIGSGIESSGTKKELEKFIETLQIPLVYSASAPDTYGLDNRLSIGSVGIMGCSRAGNFTIQNSDLVIALGSRLNSMTVGEKCQFAREAKVIVVDIDKVEHSKDAVTIDRLIHCDLKEFFNQFNVDTIQTSYKEWIEKTLHWKEIFPKCEPTHKQSKEVDLYYLSEVLSKTLFDNTSVVTDSGLIELIIPTNTLFKNNQKAIHPISQGAMGFALPALIGAYFVDKSPVITIVGDGSIMMNLQELEVIKYQKIPAKIFVINNNAYAVIRKRQNELFRRRTIGTDPSDGISCADFKKVAHTFDLQYQLIDESTNLEQQITDVLSSEGAVLCEIMGLEDQSYISTGHTRDASKKIVTRPIEDQKPFLNRDLFLKEMIVTPIHQ